MSKAASLRTLGAKALAKKSQVYGISCFKEGALELVLLKTHGDRIECAAHETIQVGGEPSGAPQPKAGDIFRKFQRLSPTWIHLVQRNVAFVRLILIPPVADDGLKAAMESRMRQELPHLADEISLHHKVQGQNQDGSVEVLITGVSKRVLSDQTKKLETFGIIPARILLSTQVLHWYCESQILSSRSKDEVILVLYSDGKQAEFLFYEGTLLRQSRSVALDSQAAASLGAAIEAASSAYQRDRRSRPNRVIAMGVGGEIISALKTGLTLPVEPVALLQEAGLPFLYVTAVEAYEAQATFDFTLPEIKASRESGFKTVQRRRLAVAFVSLAFALFLASLANFASVFAQVSWLKVQTGGISSSVKEVKLMRADAIQYYDYYYKKALPVTLLGSIRAAIPKEVLLTELEMETQLRKVLVRGIVPVQSLVDQFVSALEAESIFERVNLDRVQAEQDEKGKTVYRFAINGLLREGRLE